MYWIQVDRIDLALLIDCTEQFCVANIGERISADKGRTDDGDATVVKARLGLFKQNTLPMLKYFDEKGRLKVVRAKMRVRKQSSASVAVFISLRPNSRKI